MKYKIDQNAAPNIKDVYKIDLTQKNFTIKNLESNVRDELFKLKRVKQQRAHDRADKNRKSPSKLKINDD